jgi:hypothetical protein
MATQKKKQKKNKKKQNVFQSSSFPCISYISYIDIISNNVW